MFTLCAMYEFSNTWPVFALVLAAHGLINVLLLAHCTPIEFATVQLALSFFQILISNACEGRHRQLSTQIE